MTALWIPYLLVGRTVSGWGLLGLGGMVAASFTGRKNLRPRAEEERQLGEGCRLSERAQCVCFRRLGFTRNTVGSAECVRQLDRGCEDE